MANLPTSIKNLNTLLGEQLTDGGGGGSSDFSTAEVTITGLPDGTSLPIVYLYDDADLGKRVIAIECGNANVTALLYQGYQYIFVDSVSDWTVTGSATIDEDLGFIIITGDCTMRSGSDDSVDS